MDTSDKSLEIKASFDEAREGERGWQIREGAEPVDMRISDKISKLVFGERFKDLDKKIENAGFTAGPGGVANHNYIEILNPAGKVVKRVHGLGLEPVNGKLEMTGKGRLIGLVVDGKYTTFDQDPIQRDDRHPTLTNRFQHADRQHPITGKDYTKVVFTGSEREVMQIYGAMVEGAININEQRIKFDLLNLNSNTFFEEMKEKIDQATLKMGFKIKHYDAPGIDIGSDPDKIRTPTATLKTWSTMEELREHIDNLEQRANMQWEKVNLYTNKKYDWNITAVDLETPIRTAAPSLLKS